MNNLWVYGCSFSEPYGLEHNAPERQELSQHRILTADYWGTHLAAKLGLNCITRSRSGKGWNYITCAIEQDIRQWSRDDIIIVSPSFFWRVSIMEFINSDTQKELLGYYKSWAEISKFNESRWRNSILNYQYLGYKVFTWLIDDTINLPPNTITAPDNTVSWESWMKTNHEYWIRPPSETDPQGDWHFNATGHIRVADRMHQVICQTPQ